MLANERLLRRRPNSRDTLERLVNTTKFTTSKVTHTDIIDVGNDMLSKEGKHDVEGELARCVEQALKDEEERHKEALKEELRQLKRHLDQEMEDAAIDQIQRHDERRLQSKLEREETQALTDRKLREEFEEHERCALRAKELEFENSKQRAIDSACQSLKHKLEREFRVVEEKAIMDALDCANEKSKKKLDELIRLRRKELENLKEEELNRLKMDQEEELDQMRHRQELLATKRRQLLADLRYVESDFIELRTDIQRFYTNSDARPELLSNPIRDKLQKTINAFASKPWLNEDSVHSHGIKIATDDDAIPVIKKLNELIRVRRKELENLKEEELNRLKMDQKEELDQMRHRQELLATKHRQLLADLRHVESDFIELRTDIQRFYTNSDARPELLSNPIRDKLQKTINAFADKPWLNEDSVHSHGIKIATDDDAIVNDNILNSLLKHATI